MIATRALFLLLVACSHTSPEKGGAVDADGDGYDDLVDCDDEEAGVHPEAPERCDGLDQDCDGLVDEEAEDAALWYADEDGDGHGGETLRGCEPPAGSVAAGGDCDDLDPSRHAGAAEGCDGVDQDCDGEVDEEAVDAAAWVEDLDGDGYGGGEPFFSCEAPEGWVAEAGDCDEADPTVHPGAAESCSDPVDRDCDGLILYADEDGDGHAACLDCDDGDASLHPGAEEACDGLDQDCDGEVDEGLRSTYYADMDGDGYGDGSSGLEACAAPPLHVLNAEDCDDVESAVHPGAEERCDGLDQDCDGLADDAAVDAPLWYADADGDGHGDALLSIADCSAPAGHVSSPWDCDEGDPAVNPDAAERCDPADVDEDCDGLSDDADPGVTGRSDWYEDADGDGHAGAALTSACDAPPGHLGEVTDCDDEDPAVHPGAVEVCDPDDDDEDCDGLADDADPTVDSSTMSSGHVDSDGDGYGDPLSVATACDLDGTVGVSALGSDCDDGDPLVSPGEAEVEDGLDNNCDGLVDNTGEWHEEVVDYNAYWQLSSDIDEHDNFVLGFGERTSQNMTVRWGNAAEGWSTSTVHTTLTFSPSVAWGPEGTIAAIFLDYRYQDAWEAWYDGSRWSTSQIDLSAGASAPPYGNMAVQVDPDGMVYNYYWDEASGVGRHRVGTYGSMSSLWTDGTDPLGVSQAMNPVTGELAFGWYSRSSYSAYFNITDPTGAAIASGLLAYGGGSTRAAGCGLTLDYDPLGELYAVWQDLDEEALVFASYDAAAGRWSTEQVFSPPGYCAGDVDLAMDQDGHAHVVFVANYGLIYYPIYYYTNASGAWVGTSLASAADSPTFAEVQVDSHGNPHVFAILNASKDLVHYYVY